VLTPEVVAETERLQAIFPIYRGPSGHVYALPSAYNSFGGEIVTGDEAYDEGGAWRRMRTCRELLAWTGSALLDRVAPYLRDALYRRGIDYRDLGGAFDEALKDAVRRIHEDDRLPADAAEAAARDLLADYEAGLITGYGEPLA